MLSDTTTIYTSPFSHNNGIYDTLKPVYIRKVGRPSKATDETFDKIIDGIRNRLSYVAVATQAGISYQTLNRWKKQGAAGKYPFVEFLHAFNQAEKEAEAERLAAFDAYLIEKLKSMKWQDSARILERRYPDTWGRKPRTFILLDDW